MKTSPHGIVFAGAGALWLWCASAGLAADRLDCRPEQEAGRAEAEAAIRTAASGTDLYLPYPFPATDAEAIADFTHEVERHQAIAVRDLQAQAPWRYAAARAREAGWRFAVDLSAGVGVHLLRGVVFDPEPIRRGRVHFSVEQVEDWSHMRCVTSQARARVWRVVRAFDSATGVELSRGSLSEAGYFASGMNAPAGGAFPPWPDTATTTAMLARLSARALGTPFLLRELDRCVSALTPCVAAETTDGSTVYVAAPTGGIFRVSLVGRLLVPSRDLRDPAHDRDARRRLAPGEFLFSLGPDLVGVGELLAPPPK